MQRQKIDGSSQIVSVGYDASSMTLEIEFSSTGVYQYDGVPATVYEEFMHAESKGVYFATFIRERYPFTRLHIQGCEQIPLCLHPDVQCPCWCHKPKKEKPNAESTNETQGQARKPSRKKKTQA